ncbi:MAG: hypothetical protein Q9172_004209 [Xanthocarpia lactea]
MLQRLNGLPDILAIKTLATCAGHESDISYEAYLFAIHAANQAFRTAVGFLDELAKREPQCESLAFNIFETLIRDTWQRTEAIVQEESYNTWCSKGRSIMQIFLQGLAEDLATVGQPFSASVQELARRDGGFRNAFAWINHHSCCNFNPYSDLPHEQHFLLNQLLILSPDASPPVKDQVPPIEAISTCEVCFDQDAMQVRLTRDCEHEGGVCLACLAQAIAAQLDCKRWNELTCPLCPARLDSDTVEKYAPEETVQR